MSSFFKIQFEGFKRKSRSLGGSIINDEYKNMSSEECVEWIISLNDGSFVKYEKVLLKKFMKKKKPINGQNIEKINEVWLEDVCDFEEDHAKALSDAISERVNESETGYLDLTSDLDDSVNWMTKKRHRIKKLNEFLIRIQMEASFITIGAVVSQDLNDFKFKTLDEVISPAQSVEAFIPQ